MVNVIDKGGGSPVVLVTGLQGRWEWMAPAVDALSRRCRVIAFSLADEPSSGSTDAGFAGYVEQIRAVLDQCRIGDATICGISFGGLIAAAFAAAHPDRTRALVLVSPMPPSWRPKRVQRFCIRWPRLLSPLFWLGAPMRLYPELVAAIPYRTDRIRVLVRHLALAIRHPPRAGLMAVRAQRAATLIPSVLTGISAPTLILTGEPSLDKVVPVASSLEYATLIPHAQPVQLPRTGHVGLVTRPDLFAAIVATFAERLTATEPAEVRRHA